MAETTVEVENAAYNRMPGNKDMDNKQISFNIRIIELYREQLFR